MQTGLQRTSIGGLCNISCAKPVFRLGGTQSAGRISDSASVRCERTASVQGRTGSHHGEYARRALPACTARWQLSLTCSSKAEEAAAGTAAPAAGSGMGAAHQRKSCWHLWAETRQLGGFLLEEQQPAMCWSSRGWRWLGTVKQQRSVIPGSLQAAVLSSRPI